MRPIVMIRMAALVALTVLVPQAALASGLVHRLKPNGVDDTQQLQEALDACSGVRVPCLIELAAGVFHTDVLLARDFKGVIIGKGRGRTILRPLVGTPLRSTANVFLDNPTPNDPYPVLLHFADGADVALHGFTLEFPEDMQVARWSLGPFPTDNALLSAVMVDGGADDRARLIVSNLEIIAAEHPQADIYGSNVINAIRFEGQIRTTDPSDDLGTATPLGGGLFVARDVRIRGTGLGLALRDARNLLVDIAENQIMDTRLIGVFFGDVGGSHVTVTRNIVTSETVGIYWLRGVRPLDRPSNVSLRENAITINQAGTGILGPGDGVVFIDLTVFDDPVTGGAIDKATIERNRITLGVDAYEAVFVVGDRGKVTIADNKLSGPALDAGIFVEASSGTRIARNRFEGFAPAPDVWLLDSTSACRVWQPGATVLDEGVGNVVR
jgi:hypothetical protein